MSFINAVLSQGAGVVSSGALVQGGLLVGLGFSRGFLRKCTLLC